MQLRTRRPPFCEVTSATEGIAIPHGKLDRVTQIVGCFARSRKGVEFASQDGQLTHFFFVLVAPQEHLKALARISRVLKERAVRKQLMRAATARDLYRIIVEEDAAAAR